jgi:hypothetical protein
VRFRVQQHEYEYVACEYNRTVGSSSRTIRDDVDCASFEILEVQYCTVQYRGSMTFNSTVLYCSEVLYSTIVLTVKEKQLYPRLTENY